jgi:tetratricopeptide (TPR) repeat protein
MISREILAQFLFGKPVLQFIPLFNYGVSQPGRIKNNGDIIHAYFYQKTSDVKNYSPSKQELDELLRDTEVKDKELWKEDIAYLEMIKRSRQESLKKQTLLRSYVHRGMSIIAIPIILLLPAAKIKFQIHNKINRQLYQQFYAPIPANFTVSTAVHKPDVVFEKAMTFYLTRNFSFALKLFRSITPQSYNYQLAQFYSGICNMEQNRMEAALTHFGNIDQNSSFYSHLNWHKSLCYIKLGIVKDAIPLLSELKKSNNAYNTKAEELLTKIKNNF